MYNWMKDRATKQFWERRFVQLMAENLINMPDDYYEDSVPFKNADTLNQIFTDLEEENLGMINSLQEKHQILEQMRFKEERMHEELGKKHDVHIHSMKEYRSKIHDVDIQLELVRKRKLHNTNTEGNKSAEELMLDKLASKIRDVYRDCGFVNDVNNKEPLDILNVSTR